MKWINFLTKEHGLINDTKLAATSGNEFFHKIYVVKLSKA